MDPAAILSHLHEFNTTVFKTVHAAFAADMGADVLAAIGTLTGTVAARGVDPVQDMAALQSINKIIADLAAAEKVAKASA